MDFSEQIDSVDKFIDQTFKRSIYRARTTAHKTFEQCTFSHGSFSETSFEFCTFRDCVFTNCDLRLLRVKGSSFSNVQFVKSEASYINWTEGTWSKTGLLHSVHFSECNVSYCTFIGLMLKKFRMANCIAHDVDFSEADLAKAVFSGTDLADSRFLNTNLTGADFTNAVNYAISPLLNKVKSAKFSLPQALALLAALEITIVD